MVFVQATITIITRSVDLILTRLHLYEIVCYNSTEITIKGLKIYTTSKFEYNLLKQKGAKPILIKLKKNHN